jgi:hypothetical protein
MSEPAAAFASVAVPAGGEAHKQPPALTLPAHSPQRRRLAITVEEDALVVAPPWPLALGRRHARGGRAACPPRHGDGRPAPMLPAARGPLALGAPAALPSAPLAEDAQDASDSVVVAAVGAAGAFRALARAASDPALPTSLSGKLVRLDLFEHPRDGVGYVRQDVPCASGHPACLTVAGDQREIPAYLLAWQRLGVTPACPDRVAHVRSRPTAAQCRAALEAVPA